MRVKRKLWCVYTGEATWYFCISTTVKETHEDMATCVPNAINFNEVEHSKGLRHELHTFWCHIYG